LNSQKTAGEDKGCEGSMAFKRKPLRRWQDQDDNRCSYDESKPTDLSEQFLRNVRQEDMKLREPISRISQIPPLRFFYFDFFSLFLLDNYSFFRYL